MAGRRITLDGASLRLVDVQDVAVAERGAVVLEVTPEARAAVDSSRAVVDRLVTEGAVAYGITTGFGEFADVKIEPHQVQQLQRNLLLSHAVGVGEPLPRAVVRAMMLIRANTLCKGLSGIRLLVIERLLSMLKADITPVVPSQGSVGSSGDLAPLAHLALPLIGEGEVWGADGQAMPAAEALAAAGMEPLVLEAKEGLALINGTQMMAAIGCLACIEAEGLLHDAQITATMALEALLGSIVPFSPEIHAARPHPGQAAVAGNVLSLSRDSGFLDSHRECGRVQDAYSLRCIPQVLGACKDVIDHAHIVFEREINSATDNPLVFPDGQILSQGNFHGEPLAFQLDFLAIALSELANISERRTERMVNPDLSEGLKPFLVDAGGLNSGFMIAQYTAASLVSENKGDAHPASVDSIPTSAGQEDHNSMGSIGAIKLRRVLRNTRRVIAIEALCAAQAIDLQAPLKPGRGSGAAHAAIRAAVPRLDADRYLAPDVEQLARLLHAGGLRDAVAAAGITLA